MTSIGTQNSEVKLSKFASNYKDLSGQVFNGNTVLRRVEKPARASRRSAYWLVLCKCSEECTLSTVDVKKGSGCGCGRTPNLIGESKNCLTVIGKSDEQGRNNSQIWICRCECGNTIEVSTQNFRSGNVQSCGCKVGNSVDITGKRIGNFIVLSKTNQRKNRYVVWKARCVCGKEMELTKNQLSQYRSCGCLKNQKGPKNSQYKGHQQVSGTRWKQFLKSANKRKIDVSITIQDAWNIFQRQGRKCALSGLPLRLLDNPNASLDRIDSSLGYTITNVQWVDKRINLMKHALDQEEFLRLCRQIVDYHKIS